MQIIIVRTDITRNASCRKGITVQIKRFGHTVEGAGQMVPGIVVDRGSGGSSPRWSKQFRTAMTGLAGVSGRNDAQGLLTTTSSEKEPGGHRECAADARWVLAAA